MKQLSINVPESLNPNTQQLVAQFAESLAAKLHEAEKKYGYSDKWMIPNWEREFRDISLGIGETFKSAVISNGEQEVKLDREFEENASKLTAEDSVSFGSFEGTLDAVNIHGEAKRFWIYPQLGPKRVRCDFLRGASDQIKNALGHIVRVTGLKVFSKASPYPVRIKVKDFEVVSHEGRISLEALKGIAPDVTGGMSAVEFVRQIRNDWE